MPRIFPSSASPPRDDVSCKDLVPEQLCVTANGRNELGLAAAAAAAAVERPLARQPQVRDGPARLEQLAHVRLGGRPVGSVGAITTSVGAIASSVAAIAPPVARTRVVSVVAIASAVARRRDAIVR